VGSCSKRVPEALSARQMRGKREKRPTKEGRGRDAGEKRGQRKKGEGAGLGG